MSSTAAANPATEPAKLVKLAASYPAEVLRNPVLPLLLLEQPDWFAQLPAPALLALLRVPAAPAAVLQGLLAAAQAHPEPVVRAVLASHPQLPPAWLPALRTDTDSLVRNAARYRADAPLPAYPAVAVRETVELGTPLINTKLTVDVMQALLGVPGAVRPDRMGWLLPTRVDAETGERRAGPPDKHSPTNPAKRAYHFTDETLYLAGLNIRSDVPLPERLRLMAAVDPPQRAADWFRNDPDEMARLAEPYLPRLGWQPPAATPAELTELAARPYWLSQLVAAGHPHTPPDVRRRLLDESSHRLLWQAVAANPGWSADELRQLLADDKRRTRGSSLRWGLLHNPHTPPDVLRAVLSQYPDRADRWAWWFALAAHPQLPAEEAAELMAVTKERNTGPATLGPLLLALAANSATPPPLLAELAAYPTAEVDLRPALVANPGTPGPVLRELAAGRSAEMAYLALHHPAYPAPAATDTDEAAHRWRATQPDAGALAGLATSRASAVRTLVAGNPATPPAALGQLAADKIVAVRATVAANPATPAHVLAQLAHDDDSLVRREAAAHPATPPAQLAALAADANKYVRRKAFGNPQLPGEALPAQGGDKSEKNRLLLLQRAEGRRAILTRLAGRDLATISLLHLLLPDVLTDQHRAALAASPVAGQRLTVAHLPDYQAQLRDDPHLLVRLVARGELAAAANEPVS